MNSINKLHEILNRARISDDEIRGGIKLSSAGLEKIAARLGINSDEVTPLISALVEELRDEHQAEVTETEEPRYAYEADYMGNLTIRDSRGGEEHYVGGSDAAHLIVKLQHTAADSAEEQQVLAQFCTSRGSLSEAVEDSGDFAAELSSSAGSFNFPWRAGSQHGTGTAAYRSSKGGLDIELIDVRDGRGEVIKPNEQQRQAITAQAESFIGDA